MLKDKDIVVENTDKDVMVERADRDVLVEHKDKLYKCGDCMRIVYLMEAGRGKDLECCDRKMNVLSEKEMKPYHPRFPKPGSP